MPSSASPNRGKQVPLEEAVSACLKPGMTLYAGYGTNAILREVLRQYAGSRPEFTLVMPALSLMAINLLHAGLVRKLITAYAGAGSYPGTSPSPVVQALCKDNRLIVENWSLLSLTQRLMAGALNLPYLPTRSIAGTTMEVENPDAFVRLDDPFAPGQSVGVVKALTPDLALMHGWASDRDGYTITAPATNSGKDVWGAKASHGGTLITVERIISAERMRRHAGLVTLPGPLVTRVSETPLGAHPEAMISLGLRGTQPYEHDTAFVRDHKRASSAAERLTNWLQEWVHCGTHDDYLDKLGGDRIAALVSKPQRRQTRRPQPFRGRVACQPIERMVLAATTEIERLVERYGFSILLTGVGTPALAGWLARDRLRRKGHAIELLTGSGFVGYAPRPGNPFLFSAFTLESARMLTEPLDAHGVFAGGGAGRCLTVLNAAQLDRFGNLNSTITADGTYLVGSGGANDAALAAHVLVLMRQSRQCFVDSLPYVSTPGARVGTVISDLGLWKKRLEEDEITLTHFHPIPGAETAEEAVRQICDQCGWEPKIAPELARYDTPTERQIGCLRRLDPEGLVLK